MLVGTAMAHSGSVVPYLVFGLLSIPMQIWVTYLLFRGFWEMLKSNWQQLRTTRAKHVFVWGMAIWLVTVTLVMIGLLARG